MYRWLKIIGVVIGIVLVVVFALMNTQLVVLNFFFWRVEASFALFLIISFAIGWLIGLFIPKFRNRDQNK
ncbi:MAG: lipopolysaccharide assembly protein LapA domain-containing protein [Bacteroidales bacterium]